MRIAWDLEVFSNVEATLILEDKQTTSCFDFRTIGEARRFIKLVESALESRIKESSNDDRPSTKRRWEVT